MQIVASFKFEPTTLARLDCIPTPAHGNEKKLSCCVPVLTTILPALLDSKPF